eukprot:TRINITY_DN19832_c0_g2_i1.p1 TRINITY_DN19832_c0_g2~~TRINITY_DN19832_c0_g2_i1.p1  ORF type:complete len:973 (+),score=191.47 TRINITY_DN19832_c0_g2_i1:204-3122(+)
MASPNPPPPTTAWTYTSNARNNSSCQPEKTSGHSKASSAMENLTSISVVDADSTPASSETARKAVFMSSQSTVGKNRRSMKEEIVAKITHGSREAVDNKIMVGVTAILTAYALVGDDIRLLGTNKGADVYFDVLTIVSIFVFFVEIVLSCLGKSGYFMSFFFCLDFSSTVTLVLDISWVSSEAGSSDVRAARTARIGARAGRVVRVIRFVRILRALHKKREASKKVVQKRSDSDEDEWLEDDEDHNKDKAQEVATQESRVGKKLSELTTRRVIILVLVMLIIIPTLQTDTSKLYPVAPSYSLDVVQEAFQEAMNTSSTSDSHVRYQRSLLKLLYYNNWFTGHDQCPPGNGECPNKFYAQAFWFGIEGESPTIVEQLAANAQLSVAEVTKYQDYAKTQDDRFNFGVFPQKVVEELLPAPWIDGGCSDDSGHRRGVSVLRDPITGIVNYAVPCPAQLRPSERMAFSPLLMTDAAWKEWHLVVYFDTRKHQRDEALYGLSVTVFVCIVLTIASLTFSSAANTLVLGPVEQMINRLQMIQMDPFRAVKMSDEEFREEERLKAKEKTAKSGEGRLWNKVEKYVSRLFCIKTMKMEPMETVVLEKTIIKLGSLLALGFGEAGASIIRQNMEHFDSANVNVMLMGKVVDAIIVSARIHNFSTATEVLQRKIMTFVNQIAEIVHGVVNEYFGAPNKNNGDQFLLIWRCDSGLQAGLDAKKLADMSMIAVAKILAGIHQSPVLARYRAHPALQMNLGTNHRVCMTFGVHAGWAIEGAIGSDFKIDASYISPHVNVATKMERMAQLYGVPIIVSESVVTLSNSEMDKYCRLIDCCSIRGSKVPLCIHSLDMDYQCLEVLPEGMPIKWNNRRRFNARQFIESEKQSKRDPKFRVDVLFRSSKDICAMREPYTVQFLQTFHMGYQNYSLGEWNCARRFLVRAGNCIPFVDGPSKAILSFMEAHNFQAPANWHGVRDLDADLSMG